MNNLVRKPIRRNGVRQSSGRSAGCEAPLQFKKKGGGESLMENIMLMVAGFMSVIGCRTWGERFLRAGAVILAVVAVNMIYGFGT